MPDGGQMTPAETARHHAQMAHTQNQEARAHIFRHCPVVKQQIPSGTKSIAALNAGTATQQIQPLQVGFVRRFLVEVSGTINNTGTGTITLTPNGLDNIFSSIVLQDFTGNNRHNASARMFRMREAAAYMRIPGAAVTSDSVSGYGSVVGSNVAPATVAAAGNGAFRGVWEIPVMCSLGMDMRGGLYLGVNNQSANLILNLNANPVAINTGDSLTAMYQGGAAAAGNVSNLSIAVWQEYYNDLPLHKTTREPLLPQLDVRTAFMLQENNAGMALAANQVASWNYPTFSEVVGTYWSYSNGGVLNAGTDFSMAGIIISNYSIITQVDPYTLDRLTRNEISTSFPKGSYGFITKGEDILDVNQYPSLQLQFQPTSVGSNSYVNVCTEMFRPMQYMTKASGVGGS